MAKVLHAITLLICFTEASQDNGTTEWSIYPTVSSTPLPSKQRSTEALPTPQSNDTESTKSDTTAGTRPSHSQLTEITTHSPVSGQLLTNTSRASLESSTNERNTTVVRNDSTETTALNTSKRSPLTNTVPSKRPTTAIAPGKVNTSTTASYSMEKDRLAANAGLVAVLSIFFIILVLVLFVVIVKAITSRKPQFERLDDLPMNKMREDAPFAKCSPN